MYGWDPTTWPKWVKARFPEAMTAMAPSYDPNSRVKRVRTSPCCLLTIQLDALPPAFRVLRVKRAEALYGCAVSAQ
jgi:hypothetical protein